MFKVKSYSVLLPVLQPCLLVRRFLGNQENPINKKKANLSFIKAFIDVII